jgi:hypothetical protein
VDKLRYSLWAVVLGTIGGCLFDGSQGLEDDTMSGAAIRGDGNEATWQPITPAFSRVENHGQFPVVVSVNPAGAYNSVVATCDLNLVFLLRSRVSGETLALDTPRDQTLVPKSTCVVRVTVPELRSLRGSWTASTEAEGDLRALERVENTGTGLVSVAGLDLNVLEVFVAQDGSARLSGATSELRIDSSGAGSVEATDLSANRVSIYSASSEAISVRADDQIMVRASGSGDIEVRGDPSDRDVVQTGTGAITFR